MKKLIPLILALSGTAVAADVNLVIDGKSYEVTEVAAPDCATEGDFNAMKYTLGVAYSATITFSGAACIAQCQGSDREDCETFCSTDPEQVRIAQSKALAVVFKTVRRYPPYFKSDYCAAGRKVCEDICAGLADAKHCAVECNQYESYYKK